MYGKIFESIYDGTLAGDWQAMITFQQFIVLADSEGVVDLTPQALNRRTGIPLEILEHGIAKLQEADLESRSTRLTGKRIELLDEHREWGWSIVNYAYYRDLASIEDRRAKDRERKRAERKKQENAAGKTGVSESVRGCPPPSEQVPEIHHEDEHEDTDDDISIRASRRAPKSFALTRDLIQFAQALGMNKKQIEMAFGAFKDHEYKAARKDWAAAWRNWCRNRVEWSKNEAISGQSDDFETIHAGNRASAGLG